MLHPKRGWRKQKEVLNDLIFHTAFGMGEGGWMMFCHGQMDGGMDGTDVVIVMAWDEIGRRRGLGEGGQI